MPTSTSYKSAPTRIQVSNKKTPVFEEELPYHEFFIHWRSYRYTNRVWVEIFPSQTKKTYSWQFLVTFLGWWNVPLSKANRDLQRSGITKRSRIEITWISLSQVPIFSPKGFPPQKKHQRSVRYFTPTLISITGSRDPKQPSASWDPKTWRLRGRFPSWIHVTTNGPPVSVVFPSWTW